MQCIKKLQIVTCTFFFNLGFCLFPPSPSSVLRSSPSQIAIAGSPPCDLRRARAWRLPLCATAPLRRSFALGQAGSVGGVRSRSCDREMRCYRRPTAAHDAPACLPRLRRLLPPDPPPLSTALVQEAAAPPASGPGPPDISPPSPAGGVPAAAPHCPATRHHHLLP